MARNAARAQELCVDHPEFSLQAAVRCDADKCQQLEQICHCITRPAPVNERVQTNAEAQGVLELKTAWRDGTMHMVMSPLQILQRLAAPTLLERPL